MKRFLNLILFSLLFTNFLYAQSEHSKCPSISVEGPSALPKPRQPIPFKVIVSKEFNSSNLKYLWSVSIGKIISGQGTTSILMEYSDLGVSPTATVTVEGLTDGCPNIASETTITDCPIPAVLIDEYEKINVSDENIRLKAFSEALQNDTNSTGHFRKVFHRGFSKSAAYENLRQILNRLKSYGVDENRLTFGIAFDEKELTRIFIVPAGAETHFEVDDEILNAAQLAEKLKPVKTKSQKTLARKN